jgi:Protein of unknown function (DUF2867)
VKAAAELDPERSGSAVVRALFGLRWKIGELLGWDDDARGLGSRVPSLRERLPDDLRHAARGPDFDATPFRSLYLLDNEFAAEIANETVHGILHLGWVPDGSGGYRGQMAVLVKRNGLLGTVYMRAIAPFRHLLVYPPLVRDFGRRWEALRPT